MAKNETVTENRHLYIGGSDIAVIMNISPFKTRQTLLLEKSQFIQDYFSGNEYTEYGDRFEPKIRDFINSKRKDEKFKSAYFLGVLSPKDKDKLQFRCNVDGINNTEVLEIKTTSHIKDSVDKYKTYLVQLLFYMLNSKRKKGILAVYERDVIEEDTFNEKRLLIYEIKIDDYQDLCVEIMSSVEKFQNDLLEFKKQPTLNEEDFLNPLLLDTSKKIVELENRLIGYKKILEELENMKEYLFKSMTKFNVKKWTSNNGISFTRIDESESTREVLDTEKLKNESPEIFEKYKTTKTTKRKGYVRIDI